MGGGCCDQIRARSQAAAEEAARLRREEELAELARKRDAEIARIRQAAMAQKRVETIRQAEKKRVVDVGALGQALGSAKPKKLGRALPPASGALTAVATSPGTGGAESPSGTPLVLNAGSAAPPAGATVASSLIAEVDSGAISSPSGKSMTLGGPSRRGLSRSNSKSPSKSLRKIQGKVSVLQLLAKFQVGSSGDSRVRRRRHHFDTSSQPCFALDHRTRVV